MRITLISFNTFLIHLNLITQFLVITESWSLSHINQRSNHVQKSTFTTIPKPLCVNKNNNNETNFLYMKSHLLFDERRRLLLQKILILTSIVVNSNISPAYAIPTSTTTGELIRKSAANLPGYGKADIYYPKLFLGRWNVTKTIVSFENYIGGNLSPETLRLLQEKIPFQISYTIRFIQVGDNNDDDDETIVSDRSYNEISYYDALRSFVEMNDINVAKSLPNIRSSVWLPSNPNVQTLQYDDGSSKEIKVTKRASEVDLENNILSSSEYCRITSTAATNSVPSIYGCRTLTKLKVLNDDQIDGIELVYSDGLSGDPMAGNGSMKPQILSKCRFTLQRL